MVVSSSILLAQKTLTSSNTSATGTGPVLTMKLVSTASTLILLAAGASAFAGPHTPGPALSRFARKSTVSNLNIPRITLPEEVSNVLDEQGLKNPNNLSDEE